jgi:hypothetical protein
MSGRETRQSFVSCIMPTYNRRSFVPMAIACFLRQDYAPRELIVIDDGSDPIGDLLPQDSRIRYVRCDSRLTVGAKRNLACELARGSIIAHWDDDDWHAPWRLSAQVAALREGAELSGTRQPLYVDPASGQGWQYRYPAGHRVWLAGNSLCYTRGYWERHRFTDISIGEDTRFVWQARAGQVAILPDSTFHVGLIHAGNVSAKRTTGACWHAIPSKDIEALLGADLTACHAAVAGRGAQRTLAPAAVERSTMTPIRNVYACLVHERQDCIIDLVRNLRHLDPSSSILLYNGGSDPQLLNHGFPFERFGAVVHPQPRPQAWGRLHEFALDCMRFALEQMPFDTLTIVDSDQLALRPGYADYLGAYLAAQPRQDIGLLGNAPERQPATTRVPPAAVAYRERDLWRPLLQRFAPGEDAFVHWSFWPSTIFTAGAARDLVRLFDTDEQLREIMGRTKIWATEEVILPTLVALLGYRITPNPCSYEYVRYRVAYTQRQLDAALASRQAFWMHPVMRRYDDPLRSRLRGHHREYGRVSNRGQAMASTGHDPADLLLTLPLLQRMKRISGWLEEDEADLLIGATIRAVTALPASGSIVEVGSYCGRSTVVMGTVVKTLGARLSVVAIDPHEGEVGALDQGISRTAPTLQAFQDNIARAGLVDIVRTVRQRSYDTEWHDPINLLFIDGLHDYVNVARDFYHFERYVVPDGLVAFHDYASYYPGVVAFVDELLAAGAYEKVWLTRSLIVLRKRRAMP